jgi:hypothetical protein
MVKKTGMSLNVSELAGRMLGAAQEALSAKWPEIKDYAEGETQKLARSLRSRPGCIWIFRKTPAAPCCLPSKVWVCSRSNRPSTRR